MTHLLDTRRHTPDGSTAPIGWPIAVVEKVLVVGGGIGRLTLAAALHSRGIGAEAVERTPEWQAVGAGIAVQANGLRALRTVGLDRAVASAGTILRRWQFRSGRGQVQWSVI